MNNKFLALVCLIAAICMGVTTSSQNAIFMHSFSNGSVMGYALAVCGICMDLGKYLFPVLVGIHYSQNKYMQVLIYAILSFICIVISVTASWTYDLNKSNEINNTTVIQSDGYKRQSELFNTTTDSISSLKKDIEDLKTTKDAEIEKSVAGLKESKAALPSNYITQKNNTQAQIDKTTTTTKQKIEKSIAEKESELKDKENNLNTVNTGFDEAGKDLETTKGVNSLAKWLNPSDPEKTIGYIVFVKSVLIEIIAIAFSVAFGVFISAKKVEKPATTTLLEKKATNELESLLKQYKNYPTEVIDCENPKPNDKIATSKKFKIKPHNKIGFDPSIPEKRIWNDDELQIYVDCMDRNQKDGVSPGYQKIAFETGLGVEKCRQIRGHLRMMGHVETIGSKTLIKKV